MNRLISRSRRWLINSRRDDLMNKDADYLYKNIKFCSLHFEESQFMNKERKKLVWNAVPTLFDIRNQPPQVSLKRKLPTRYSGPASKITKQDEISKSSDVASMNTNEDFPVPGPSAQTSEEEIVK